MLEKYREKRDFRRTTEPPPAQSAGVGGLRFVVQKHDASRLHYDLRLEWDGVLKSWAVPKGPTPNPKEKRLAVMVEDHPLPYASYEGVIAEGNYGAGEVIVWDTGVYSPDEGGRLSFGDRLEAEERMRQGLATGKLSFTLRGQKLHGSWALVKTSRSDNEWLLIKHRDQYATNEGDILERDHSVLSDLTLADLKAGRMPEPTLAPIAKPLIVGTPAPWPKSLRPMLATSVDKPFSHPDWMFEPKLDGFRVLATIREGSVTLLSRTARDMTAYFPEVVQYLAVQPQHELILDGEIVALNEQGIPEFQLLQNSTNLDFMGSRRTKRTGAKEPATIVYYPFDILYLDGRSLIDVPLSERKSLLAEVLVPGEAVKPVDAVAGQGETFYRAAEALGIEGMVAKKQESLYQPGVRTNDWLKIKTSKEQDLVVGGYTKGVGERGSTFGALVVGYHQGNTFQYAGRVGTGFNQVTLAKLLASLRMLQTPESLFSGPVNDVKPEDITWTRLEMVVRVRFAQWTFDKRLRAPVFLGVRSDLEPKDAVLEVVEPVRTLVRAVTPFALAQSNAVASVLEQLDNTKDKLILEVEGQRISLTNLNKILWPKSRGEGAPSLLTSARPAPEISATEYTKRDMVRYYAQVGLSMIPHLRNRPLTLTRYPNGIHGENFYQKRWENATPDFVEVVCLFSPTNEGDVEYVVVNNLPTLLWLAQLANIEFHPWLSSTVKDPDGHNLSDVMSGSQEAIETSVLNYPDFIAFDLDPYIYSGDEAKGKEPEFNRRAFDKGVQMAKALKSILDSLSLSAFIKTSGKTGLHIYVPIMRRYPFTVTRKACEVISKHLLQMHPHEITMEWSANNRTGKIFLDHNQNTRGKNMASIYSLRPLPGAPVSTPVTWEELDHVYPSQFTMVTLPPRLAKVGDLWGNILGAKHDLSRLL